MFTFRDLNKITETFKDEPQKLREYGDICSENIKDLTGRSNIISFVVLSIAAFYFFTSSVKTVTINGFDIDRKVVMVVSPLLLSYLIFEWCLLAKKRRELMKVLQWINILYFDIDVSKEASFPIFSPNTRNLMTFSFIVELININSTSKIYHWCITVGIYLLFICVPSFIGYTLYLSFTLYPLNWQIVICTILTAICLISILHFYIMEIFEFIKMYKDNEALKNESSQYDDNGL